MNDGSQGNYGGGAGSAARQPDQRFCFACGHLIHVSAANCPSCGAHQSAMQTTATPSAPSVTVMTGARITERVFCTGCGTAIHAAALACPRCGAPQRQVQAAGQKSRIGAALFAIFLGGIGIHKFYLGQPGWGVLYLLFCWTFIPGLVALIEGIVYLCQSDQEFAQKYC